MIWPTGFFCSPKSCEWPGDGEHGGRDDVRLEQPDVLSLTVRHRRRRRAAAGRARTAGRSWRCCLRRRWKKSRSPITSEYWMTGRKTGRSARTAGNDFVVAASSRIPGAGEHEHDVADREVEAAALHRSGCGGRGSKARGGRGARPATRAATRRSGPGSRRSRRRCARRRERKPRSLRRRPPRPRAPSEGCAELALGAGQVNLGFVVRSGRRASSRRLARYRISSCSVCSWRADSGLEYP